MFRIKFFVLAVLATVTLTSMAEAPNGWANAHKNAHSKEQLATNKSRLDISVLEKQRQEEIKAREAAEDGISIEGQELIADLLKEASSHLGKKYRYGSKGPSTFDCSGFSGYVFRQFGFQIGASSRDQYTKGKAIDKKNLHKGDLVFFTSRNSGKNVGHVGIVWDVDEESGAVKFIHSSTTKGVVISDLDGAYARRYIGAKRVVE